MFSRPSPTSSFVLMILVFGGVLVAGVVLSNFQREAGVAEASASSIAAVASAEDAARLLEEGTDYPEFEAAMRDATIAHERVVLFSAVDNDVRLALGRALPFLELARQAWQAHDAGDWDQTSYGDPDYVQARAADIQASELGDEVALEELFQAALAAATPHMAEARTAIGM